MRGMRVLAVFLMLLTVVTGCATGGRTAGDTVDDGMINASVKSKLVADKVSNLTRVDVDTRNGVVYLNGSVDNEDQRMRAEQIAREAKGVQSVVNNLTIRRR